MSFAGVVIIYVKSEQGLNLMDLLKPNAKLTRSLAGKDQ